MFGPVIPAVSAGSDIINVIYGFSINLGPYGEVGEVHIPFDTVYSMASYKLGTDSGNIVWAGDSEKNATVIAKIQINGPAMLFQATFNKHDDINSDRQMVSFTLSDLDGSTHVDFGVVPYSEVATGAQFILKFINYESESKYIYGQFEVTLEVF